MAMGYEELLKLDPDTVPHNLRQEEVVHIFKKCEAFWQWDENPKRPHVELTAGGHSDGYVNCRIVLAHDNLRRLLARQLVHQINLDYPSLMVRRNDWVIGSDTSATELACDIAFLLGCRHGVMRKDEHKNQIWRGECVGNKKATYRTIAPGELVIHIEELMTTAMSAERVRQGIRDAHPNVAVDFAEFLPVLMYRSTIKTVEDSTVVPINHLGISNWDANDCKPCKLGSPVVQDPKAHWEELNAAL